MSRIVKVTDGNGNWMGYNAGPVLIRYGGFAKVNVIDTRAIEAQQKAQRRAGLPSYDDLPRTNLYKECSDRRCEADTHTERKEFR